MSESRGLVRLFDPMLANLRSKAASADEQKALSIVRGISPPAIIPFEAIDRMVLEAMNSRWRQVDPLSSSVLTAPLNYLMRTFPEAPPVVERQRGDQWEREARHPLTDLLAQPNPYYSGRMLWMATILDFAFGSAKWLKVRNAFGDVVELWWAPSALLRPRWPQSGVPFISHYEYTVNGRTFTVPVRDVVHFRFGIDPCNTREGLSQLGGIMREVGIDETAASFAGTILEKLGIVGLVISPATGSMASPEDVKSVKEYVDTNFTGTNRGRALALGTATNAQLLQYNLQGFDMSPLRDVAEERVCAALGLPAAVVGFGTGLQQTKVGTTMREMRRLAWTDGIIPQQKSIADEINRSLLPEFESGRRFDARMTFDFAAVPALMEEANEKHTRVREDYRAGIIDRAEARRETGREVRPEDKGVFVTSTAGNQPSGTAVTEDEEDDEDDDAAN